MENQERLFRIAVGEFSDQLLEEIWRATYDFTIPLILNDHLVGSGTLVTVEGSRGILTAAHVITKGGWDNTIGVRQGLVTTLDRRASFLWERMENLDWWLTPPGTSEQWGPDLAFVRLPQSGGFIEALKSKKSFWTLKKDPARRIQLASSGEVFAAVCGFVDEETRDGEPESGFSQVKRLQGYSFIGGPTGRHTMNGYDFIDVAGDRTTCSSIPSDFGGVSGGGVWTFSVNRLEGDPAGFEKLAELTLAGVAFYQLDRSSDKPIVRAHGPESVYQIALAEILKWLQG